MGGSSADNQSKQKKQKKKERIFWQKKGFQLKGRIRESKSNTIKEHTDNSNAKNFKQEVHRIN